MPHDTDGEVPVPVFLPPLTTLLVHQERTKGAPLTEAEALAIRDGAVVMMMAPERAAKMAEARGYDDIDPDRCWAEWQRVRAELI